MKSNICGIYKITSPSKKVYIGQSFDIKRRLWFYKKLQCRGQRKLYHSLKKYGYDNHKVEVINVCAPEQLNELEMYYINLYNSFNSKYGLNLMSGGGSSLASEETKIKQSKYWKNYYKVNKEAYNKLVAQLKSIDRDDKNNPNYGKGRRVTQFSKKGVMLKTYISVTEAVKENSKLVDTGIYGCCHRKQMHQSSGGYVWRFEDDCIIIDGKLQEKILFRKIQKNKSSQYKGVHISENNRWHSKCYDPNTQKNTHLGLYNSELDAARAQNVFFKTKYSISEPLHDISDPFGVDILPNKIIKTRGVKWNGRHQFESRIVYKGKEIYIGGFYTEKEAAIAYNKRAFELLGDKAKLNVVA